MEWQQGESEQSKMVRGMGWIADRLLVTATVTVIRSQFFPDRCYCPQDRYALFIKTLQKIGAWCAKRSVIEEYLIG